MFCYILQALHVHEGIIYGLKLFYFNMSEESLLILCSLVP